MTTNGRKRARPARRAAGAITLAFATGFAAGGCDSLLDVELPGAVTEEGLLQPALAQTAAYSAMADFECAFSEFVSAVGGLEDAYWESTGWFTNQWAAYQVYRTTGAVNTQECGVSDTAAGFYVNFQAARFQAKQVFDFVENLPADAELDADTRARIQAQAAVVAGYTLAIFGEHWCSMAVDVGPELTPAETLARSEEWFDTALARLGTTGDFSTANTPSMLQFAYLGRARVRFALGDATGAASDAGEIDEGFVAVATRSSATRKRWNQVYQHLSVNKYGSVPPQVQFQGSMVPFTGYRGLTIAADGRAINTDQSPYTGAGSADSRVPVEDTGQIGADGVTPHWIQMKYPSHADPIPMAKWEEAQLILAEIEGGQGAIDRVNAIRTFHGLPTVTYLTAGQTAEIQDMLIEERRRTFFYEGHWHADKLRNDLFFPEGLGFNHKGVAYGTTTCLELSERERQSNPNIAS